MVFNCQSMSINLVQFFRRKIYRSKKGWGIGVAESFQYFQKFSTYFHNKELSFFRQLRENVKWVGA